MSSESPIARDCDTCGAAEAPALTHRGVVIGRVCDRCVDGLIADASDTSSDEDSDNVATTESKKMQASAPRVGLLEALARKNSMQVTTATDKNLPREASNTPAAGVKCINNRASVRSDTDD